MKNLITACIAFSLLCILAFKTNLQTNEPDWLVGTWENRTARGSLYETWKKNSLDEFSGKSYMINGRDTVLFESIRLVRIKKILTYIPTISGQNNNKAVNFPLLINLKNKIIFENKNHDFPQRISYTRINKDSLVAEISGTSKGKARREVFPMARIK